MDRIGDLWLSFGAAAADAATGVAGRTGAEWTALATGATWRLRGQAPAPGWRGWPLRTGRVGPQRFWLLGELFGTADPAGLVAEVLAGKTEAGRMNGRFLLWAWDEAAQEWGLWSDRFGTLHAYHAAPSDGGAARAALSTFFPAAAQAGRRRLDWEGLTSFFHYGLFLQDRTFYDDTRILRPASHYRFDGHGRRLAHTPTWQWRHAPDYGRSYADTVDEFAHHLGQVVREQAGRGRALLPLSGGLDSRSLAAALGPAARDGGVRSYAYGYTPDSVETAVARRVAQAAGLPFQAYTLPPTLFDQLPHVTACLEGFQDVTQARQAGIVAQLAGQADAILGGHLGDLWLDDMGLDGAAARSAAQLLGQAQQKMAKGGRRWLLEQLCRPQLGGAAPEEVAHGLLAEELARLPAIAEADFRLKALKVTQWVFRWTNASLRMFQPAAWVRLPFYDARLADFFSSVPTAYLRGRRLQIDYLKRYAPALARVPWQAYDADLYHYQQFHSWRLPRRALKKGGRALAQRLLGKPPVIERNWEAQFLIPGGRRALAQRLLAPGLRLHEFVAPTAVDRLLSDFYAAPQAGKRGYTVAMLLSFGAWLEAVHG